MYLLFDHQYSEFIILLDRNLLNRWKNLNIYLKKKKEKKRERVDYGEAWRNMKCAFFFWDKGVGSLSNQVSISGVFKKMICNQAIPLPKF